MCSPCTTIRDNPGHAILGDMDVLCALLPMTVIQLNFIVECKYKNFPVIGPW